jgi:glycosyltransferase involved in cell wall biosynthesis
MFPLFKKRTKVTEIKVLDLTINSTLEDDYFLPHDIKQELLKRGIRANCTPLTAEKRIEEWEDEYSINSIRREYNEGNWEEVVTLATGRINVHEGTEPHIHKIRSLYQLERWQECIESCNGLLDVEENNVNALRFIARCARNLGSETLANQKYLQLFDLNNEDLDSLMSLIRMNYTQKNFKKSIHYAEMFLEIDPKSIDCIRMISRSYLAMNDFSSAKTYLEMIVENDGNDLEAIISLGRGYYSIKEFVISKEYLEKAHSISPEDRRARRTLAMIYERAGEWKRASIIYELECKEDPYLYSNWEKHISLLYKLNRVKDAKKCVDLILSEDSESMELFVLAHAISRSYFWNDLAENIQRRMELKWRRNSKLYLLLAKNSLDSGNLTDCYVNLKKIKRSQRKNEDYVKLESRFNDILKMVEFGVKDIKKAAKIKQIISIEECAVRKIFMLAEKITRYAPRKTNQKLVMASSTLGRGGAERQLLTCLRQIEKSKKFTKVFLLFREKGSEDLDSTYLPEISKLDVELHEYKNDALWANTFGQNAVPEEFGQILSLLPKTMQNSIEKHYLAIRKIKPDIVHAWQDQTNIEVAIASKMAGVPGVVLFARSLRPDGKTMAHMRKRGYLKPSYKTVLADETIILAHNSNAGSSSYSNWLNIPERRFAVIHNGVDFEEFVKSSKDADLTDRLEEMGIDDDCIIIGGVFRLVREKRPLLWINSIMEVLKNNSKVHGIIVGGGPLEHEMLEHIKNIGAEGRIHLVGRSKFVKAWLDRFDMFLLTSSVEGLPNVLIEAQGFGVPVITTRAGGASDTIIQGETGYVVEDNAMAISEQIISCLNDLEWLQRATVLAVSNSRTKFSPESMAENLFDIYLNSIKNHIE